MTASFHTYFENYVVAYFSFCSLAYRHFMLNLDLQNASSAEDIPGEAQVLDWLQQAMAVIENDSDTALTVRVVDTDEGRELNLTWRGKDYPTNVLSFPFEMPEGLPPEALDPYLGDLVLCAPVVSQEAQEQNKQLDAHWAHLLVHGLLHLLGYDHQSDAEAEVMEALETRVVTRLGYAPPYQAEMRND